MSYCVYQEIQGSQHKMPRRLRCACCGFVTEPTSFPVEIFQAANQRECVKTWDRVAIELPNLVSSILRYLSYEFLQKHEPCTDDEILERFRHCSACSYYNDAVGKCDVCACLVNLLPMGEGRNKLNDRTNSCPREIWRKIQKQR